MKNMNYGPTREEKKRFLSPPLQQFLNEYDKHYAIDEMSVLPRDYVTGLNFLVLLSTRNVVSLSDVSFEDVKASFLKKDMTYKQRGYSRKLKSFFNKGIIIDKDNCLRILSYIPRMSKSRKNIQYLTTEEITAIRKALDNPSSNLTYRNRAIGMLLLYTGMRACDIIHLTFADIHWEEELIVLKQQKTKRQLRIPLRPIVGNAIYKYLDTERPEYDSDRVFLSSIKPIKELHDGSCGTIVRQILKCANVRQGKNDRKGTHIFRHRVTAKLLEINTRRPLISSLLGHVSPTSLDPYLNTDFEHLRQCSLDIREYSTSEGKPYDE